MVVRRRAWLTREGWYYVALLAFIIGGAVLRSVNLLVVLAGTLIAPPLFNWRLVMASLMELRVRRQLPGQAVAGEPLTVEFQVHNSRRWLSSWLVTVEDWITREGETKPRRAQPNSWTGWGFVRKHLQKRRSHARALIVHVPAGGTGGGNYRITLFRRGRYRLGPLRVSTRFPLGLVRGQMTIPAPDTLVVAPRLGRMLPDWTQLLEAELVGDERRHPHRGLSEGDYYGLRPWQRGDSLRWVHWRTTAKLARPMVRQFERRRSRDVVLVLDPWLAEGGDEHLLELAISVTATALHDIAARGHARLALVVGGAKPRVFCGPSSGLFCEELFAHLAVVQGTESQSMAEALALAAEQAPAGCRIVVISPRRASDKTLMEDQADLPIDPEDLAWVDVSSAEIGSLFLLS